MKYLLIILGVAVSLNVHASRFYTESGKVIMKGDQIGKVLIHAGDPLRKRYDVICTVQKKNYCARWDDVEYWYYQDIRQDNLYWVLTIMGERVNGLKWYR
jgi:hypothetical protein